MFIGRDREIELLTQLFRKKTASLVICKGRRRIGKSTLIQEFGKKYTFLEFQGLPPREGISSKDQLGAFSGQLAKQTGLPTLSLESWPQAFSVLASVMRERRTVVLLDEISWLSGKDRDFAGHLKIAWDTELKKFRKLILVACGSVSSWIDQNILNSTGFMGRVSLELNLTELPLHHCNRFWGRKAQRVSSREKFKILSVTGGVPRYLEEIDTSISAEENIKRMCFTKEGILFSEFDRIFSDIFNRRAASYKEIVGTLGNGSKSISEICAGLGRTRSGQTSRYVQDLVASGFVGQDRTFEPGNSRPSRLVRFRLKDNYLRFFLKYIHPLKASLLQGVAESVDLESLLEWEVIMGFQFENLVLNNIRSICELLSVNMSSVRSASPYFQKKTQRRKGCQIDLLIQTRYTLYVCEIKFRNEITRHVIPEVQEKAARLENPKNMTVRPVLIYEGNLDPGIEEEDFFDRCICFADLLEIP